MSTEPITDTYTTGFIHVRDQDPLTQRCYNMDRDASVRFSLEHEDGEPVRVWLENIVTGRREDVPVEAHAPFVLFLVDMILEVGEDGGRPWRR